jgi:hypothetical protein
MLASGLCSALALWLAGAVPHWLADQQGRHLLGSAALVLAALLLVRPHAKAAPREPTQSLFAALLVFIARQVADSPRWLLFGLALLSHDTSPLVVAGTLGPAVALLITWTRA